VLSRWWNQWIWSSERRRHGETLRAVLEGWDPTGAREGARPGPWARDEELLTGALTLLWQGASAGDLARWLEGSLAAKYQTGSDAQELEDLARRLVACYEERIFGED
jgi:hypothetical protein